jgi:putative transposase
MSLAMSMPREIVPMRTYLISRRVVLRHFLFRPDSAIVQLILYTLAVCARRFGLEVHALCAMSNHLHLVATDVQGLLPCFLHDFHRAIALGTKVLRKWDGSVWDSASTSVVRLETPAVVVEKIAYVLANPVTAGLVRYAHEWPGAKVRVENIGIGLLSESRPAFYFDPENPDWPAHASIPIALPPNIAMDGAAFREAVAVEVARCERAVHEELQRNGQRVLGPEQVRAVSPYEKATSHEPLRDCNPTFAAGHEQEGAWQGAAAAVRAFRTAYRAALKRWRGGARDALFPVGTWWMRVFHHAGVNAPALPCS